MDVRDHAAPPKPTEDEDPDKVIKEM